MSTRTQRQVDGRIQRSERSRQAIVQALIDLVGEGILAPTAQQVAKRADVGVRTVFRHFSDMETLFAAMNQHLTEQASVLFVLKDQSGPIGARIHGLIERRAEIFEFIEPYRRAQEIQRWRSPFLREKHEASIRMLRMDLGRWLPEIALLDDETAEALELMLSFEAWSRLRRDQKLGVRRAQNVLHRTLVALLPESSR